MHSSIMSFQYNPIAYALYQLKKTYETTNACENNCTAYLKFIRDNLAVILPESEPLTGIESLFLSKTSLTDFSILQTNVDVSHMSEFSVLEHMIRDMSAECEAQVNWSTICYQILSLSSKLYIVLGRLDLTEKIDAEETDDIENAIEQEKRKQQITGLDISYVFVLNNLKHQVWKDLPERSTHSANLKELLADSLMTYNEMFPLSVDDVNIKGIIKNKDRINFLQDEYEFCMLRQKLLKTVDRDNMTDNMTILLNEYSVSAEKGDEEYRLSLPPKIKLWLLHQEAANYEFN